MHVDFGQIFSPVYSHANKYLKLTEAYNLYAVWSPLPTQGWAKSLQSCLTFCNPTNVTHQATLSMGFSRQGYWSGFLCPPPGDLPNPGIEPASLGSPTLAGGFFSTNATWEAHTRINIEIKKMLRTIKHGKAHGRERYFYSTTLWETKETMGILIFRHFCRAIWMGEREYLRRISQSRLKGREWGEEGIEVNNPWALQP